LFIGASVASSANSATSTVNSENIFHSTVFKDNNDRCYNRTEVWKDFPYKDEDQFLHNGDGWYDKENDTLHLIEGEDIDHLNDAIDLVYEHGTVYIHSGDYNTGRTTIRLDKSLNLTGEDKNTTTIIGYVTDDGIVISSWYVNITGFTIRDAGSSAWLAGIKITILQTNRTTNNIYNNILSNNYNGLYVANVIGTPKGQTSVKIFKNKIFNNTNDGVILRHANNAVHDNEIFNNGRNGIGLWNSHLNTIENNTIYNNGLDGIWNDGSGDNMIRGNTIKDNIRNGITFAIDFENTVFEYTCEYNHIYNNTIKSNKNGGISLYHSNQNKFWNNTIEDNKEFGFKILQILKRKDYTNAPSSTDNRIYHNNFINNGDANGVDTGYFFLADNDWDNENVSGAPDINNPSHKGGNYWSDYCDRYDHSKGDKEDGVWNQDYEMFIQLVLNLKDNAFFYTLSTHSFTFDKHPCCKKYGWIPTVPEIPHQPIPAEPTNKSNGTVNETLWFSTSTTDLNEDNITYKWDWDDGSGGESDPSYPGKEVRMSHYWGKKGTYHVKVKAIDGDAKNGSNWSFALKVEIENCRNLCLSRK